MQLLNNAIGIEHFLLVSAIVFSIGIYGIITNRKNMIYTLMSIELMLFSVNINLVAFSSLLEDLTGQIFTIFILTIAAAEASIGLAILVSYYRIKRNINIATMNEMKG